MNESEWKTRKSRIDTKLEALGWKIVPFSSSLNLSNAKSTAVEELPTANGPADYGLFVDGKLLGIIEAKKVSVGPQNVLEQAKRYAKGVYDSVGNWDGLKVPFLYATNGEIIHHLDSRDEVKVSRRISDFHTPGALEELFERNKQSSLDWLESHPNNIERLRPYQFEAIDAIEKSIADGRRSMLLAMATGTGKTFTTISLLYRILESKLAKRVLFLVDRRALALQATQACASFTTPKGNKFDQEYEIYSQRFRKDDFEEGEKFDPKVLPSQYLTQPASNHTFVYISTIQRMTINLLGREYAFGSSGGDSDHEDDADKLDIPIHAFDLIIADECHRGFNAKETSTWRKVLDHFDATRIGLTATPAQHTISVFNHIAYRYTTEQAILDGYLVDYEPTIINSGVRMKGAFLSEGESVGVVDTKTGEVVYDELEDEREFSSEKIERDITVPDSNRKIIEEVAKHAYEHEKEFGRFPKILIFAANDLPHRSHCDSVVQICRDVFNQGDDFVQKITGSPSVDRPLQKIKEFRNRPNPKVVVSVDMLSTGVDIPCLEFIVFLRPIKSRILWVQMLGRGTRLCPEINKQHFRILDCFGGTLIEYFDKVTDFKVELPKKEPIPLKQVIENIYQNTDRKYYTKVLVKRLRRVDRTMSGNAREEFQKFIPDGDVRKFADELTKSLKDDFTETMKLLRDENFQDLMLNYERARKSFLIAYETKDTVTSEIRFRSDTGSQNPEDYLDSFARFVNEKSSEIEALQIVLEKPRGWSTKALEDLRQSLLENKFSEKDLQRAHEIVSHKSLADIISIVKKAAKEDLPLYSVEERVDTAISRFSDGKEFTEEQSQWLLLIREHLVKNLTLDSEDFDVMPIFSNRGGLGKARKIFGERMNELIEEINYQMAA